MAVSRGQDRSNQKAVSSDEPDRAHIVFLPYVDLAFADRRTVGFLEQYAKAGERVDALRAHLRCLRRSGPPETILAAVRSPTLDDG